MSRLIAFDCSGASCSAAVLVDDTIMAERFQTMDRGQGEALFGMMSAVMTEARMGWAGLDAVATTVGPGSFTGVRLGLAAARGLALAARKPLVTLTSFAAVAAGLKAGGRPIAIVIDSRRGPLFAQRFNADRQPQGEAAEVEPAALAAWLGAGAWWIAGDGVGALSAESFAPSIELERAPRFVRAGDLARAAARVMDAGEPAGNRCPPAPFYLRGPDAKPSEPRR